VISLADTWCGSFIWQWTRRALQSYKWSPIELWNNSPPPPRSVNVKVKKNCSKNKHPNYILWKKTIPSHRFHQVSGQQTLFINCGSLDQFFAMLELTVMWHNSEQSQSFINFSSQQNHIYVLGSSIWESVVQIKFYCTRDTRGLVTVTQLVLNFDVTVSQINAPTYDTLNCQV
jgi:hypothetical protein